MRFPSPRYKSVFYLSVMICVALGATSAVFAQSVGGDLGGSAGIFRPKNPETRRRAATRPATGARKATGKSPRGKTTGPSAEEIENKFEDALDEGNQARDARRYPDAEKSYRGAVQLKPRDTRGYYGLGNVYTDLQRWEEAEKAYRQSVEFGSNNVDAHIALSFVLVQPRSGSSLAKRLADAELAARRAIQLQPNSAVAYDRLGVALEARGILNGDTEQAYRRSIELDPQFAVGYVHLARLLRKMNRASESDPLLRRATELASDAPTLVLIAESLQSELRYEDSEPLVRRALELDPKNVGALYLQARYYVANRRFSEAEVPLKQAIEISPKSTALYSLLGSAYLRLERYEDAEQTYMRGIEFASAGDRKQMAGAFGLAGVGDGYMKTSRPNDAARVYMHALEYDPDNVELQGKLSAARSSSK